MYAQKSSQFAGVAAANKAALGNDNHWYNLK
jgi:hypothetical protein